MFSFPKPAAEQFFRTFDITLFAVSKDEKQLVFAGNLGGKFNLWAMDLPRTYPYPLTSVDQDVGYVLIDPKRRFIIAGFDRDGDENFHIYALPPEGGNPLPLLEPKAREKFFAVHLSEDGERIYYHTSRGNPTYLNICRYDLAKRKCETLLVGQDAPVHLLAASPKETGFAWVKLLSNTHQCGFVKKGEEAVSLTPNPEEAHIVSSIVYTSENHLYFVTDYGEEYAYVAGFDLEKREFAPVVTFEREEARHLKWHAPSRTLYISTVKGVSDRLYAFRPDDRTLVPVSLPVDIVDQLHVAESGTLYLLGRGATVPPNLFRKRPGGGWEALTDNRVMGVSREAMVEPEVVTYPSFDGLKIEALLFRAKPERANGYAIFWPHGGPQWAERKRFRALFQFLLARGYTIFAPNFRGSTGYGKRFRKMVERDWGGGPRLDCVAGMEWLFRQGIAERDKLFVVGGSYGGYMTLLLAGRHPEYVRAAVDLFGPSDLFTFIESVPDFWKPSMKQLVGDPVENREKLTEDSPITYLKNMKKPMLIIQGANDPRVVRAESDQIVAALKKRGVGVEYLVLEDEGHGFTKKENEIRVYRRILEFLERHRESGSGKTV
ncbi:MAG: S9 family peptidase [Planifilum fulgidum]